MNGSAESKRHQALTNLFFSEDIARKLSPTPATDFLWHYTDATAFAGIISNREIWATDFRSLNDSTEVHLAAEMLCAEFTKRKRALYDSIFHTKPRDQRQKQQAVDWWYNGYERILNRLAGRASPLSSSGFSDSRGGIFIASFSEAKNELSQWRAYANSGGFSIGLSPRWLFDICAVDSKVHMLKCVYDESEQKALVRSFLESELNAVERKSQQIVADQSDQWHASVDGFNNDFQNGRLAGFFDKIQILAACLKNKAFDAEREWRLVAREVSPWNQRSRAFVRPGSGGLRMYTKIAVSPHLARDGGTTEFAEESFNDDNAPQLRVFVGPGPQLAQNRIAAERLLAEMKVYTGGQEIVHVSDIPYRS